MNSLAKITTCSRNSKSKLKGLLQKPLPTSTCCKYPGDIQNPSSYFVVFKKSAILKSLFATVTLLFKFNVKSTSQAQFSQTYRRQLDFTFNGKNYSCFTCSELFPYDSMTSFFPNRIRLCFNTFKAFVSFGLNILFCL